MDKSNQLVQFKNENDLKQVLAKQYMVQIENLLGEKTLALEFLTNVVTCVQRIPKLLECTPETLLNSFMTMASLKLMPSAVSGEAFVLPYENRKKGVAEAQFQIGYQGWVTLFYRAGARSIVAEIVYAKDSFSNLNGEINHSFDPFMDDRGEAIGAYVIIELQHGGRIYKAMSKKQILAIGQKFSKSFGTDFSPWNEKSDPERWMWKKTVLKQAAKLVPKNETIYKALAADNKDSVIDERSTSTGLELEAGTPVNVEAHVKALRGCKTLAALETTWADIHGDAKTNPEVKAAVSEMKAILAAEAGETEIV